MYKRLILFIAITSACASAVPASATPSESGARVASYWFELIDASGAQLPTYTRDGRTYVLGEAPDRYQVRVHNNSGQRIEAVISLDGRDALDGKNASPTKRGYIINAWDDVTVDGFRLDQRSVATFRFSSVADSYAAKMGNARNVGVIGVAIFPERVAQPIYVPQPRAYTPRPEPWYGANEDRNGAGGIREYSPPPVAPAPRTEVRRKSEGNSLGELEAPSSVDKSGDSDSVMANGSRHAGPAKSRAGLGTEFGEARASYVTTTQFRRARNQPDYVLTIRYNDRAGLTALGILPEPNDENAELYRRETAQPFAPARYASPPPGWRP